MIQKAALQELIDYILLNTYKVKSNGLYNGKAGLSLSLFVASDYLQDERLEDKAFDLLQKSLITKSKDFSFENGWSGIGYALLYLIENKLLEADFDEIFGEQHEEIIKSYKNIDKEPIRLINSLQVIYYFSKILNIKREDVRLQKIIKKIMEGVEMFLIVHFNDFADIRYINDKASVLNIYETYLKLVDYSDYKYLSESVLKDYVELYRKGRIVSSLTTGIYLNKILKKNHIKNYEDVIRNNIIVVR